MTSETPDFRAIAMRELPPEEQSAERYEIAADRLCSGLLDLERLIHVIDPEGADERIEELCRALRGKPSDGE